MTGSRLPWLRTAFFSLSGLASSSAVKAATTTAPTFLAWVRARVTWEPRLSTSISIGTPSAAATWASKCALPAPTMRAGPSARRSAARTLDMSKSSLRMGTSVTCRSRASASRSKPSKLRLTVVIRADVGVSDMHRLSSLNPEEMGVIPSTRCVPLGTRGKCCDSSHSLASFEARYLTDGIFFFHNTYLRVWGDRVSCTNRGSSQKQNFRVTGCEERFAKFLDILTAILPCLGHPLSVRQVNIPPGGKPPHPECR